MAVEISVLDGLKRKVERLKDSIDLSIKSSVENNKIVLKKMQTEDQLFNGINSENEKIKPSYSLSTIKYKKRKNQPFNRVTLKDTGDFYKSIRVEAKATEFTISTKINYSVFLINKYSKILGITNKNLETFIKEYTLPVLKTNFDDIIAES